MIYLSDIEFPPELDPYRDIIERSLETYIEIEAIFNSNTTWWQSKFSGLPYLSKNVDYFKTPDGNYLYLLAQINFAEVPPLKHFPKKGILQFSIVDDELYGYDCDLNNLTKQNGFRLLYFSEPTLNTIELVTNFDFLPSEISHEEPYILLLQIDSERRNGVEIQWGDWGVCNFFIQEAKLKQLDFTKVIYNWDCH